MNSSPHPDWKIGDPILAPFSEMLAINPAQISSTDIYKLLIGAVVPRPIAFVSTMNESGVGNLAPFSFFNGVSSNPPALMISIARQKNGSKKDTLLNIESTRQFVVNTVSEWLAEPMNQCSAAYPYGVDEMTKVGLTPIPSVCIKPMRVKEAAIQMECELYGSLEVGDGSEGSSTIVVGKILMIHVAKEIYRDGKILIEPLKPLARLAGASYGITGEIFDIPRPHI